jgi:hypothetical protein
MDRKPGQPEEQERQRPTSAPGEEAGVPGETERLGPLALRRMRKDDGRALILYSREPPAP